MAENTNFSKTPQYRILRQSNSLCTDTTYVVDREARDNDKMLNIHKTVFKIFALAYDFPRKYNVPNNVRILEVPEM